MTDKNGDKRELQDPKTGRFVEGNPGGPGRPTFSLISILKEELQKVPENQKHTAAYLLIQRILKSAIQDGSDAQIRNILQYVEGMPKQPIEMSGDLAIDLIKKLSDVDTTENNAGDEVPTPSEPEGSSKSEG